MRLLTLFFLLPLATAIPNLARNQYSSHTFFFQGHDLSSLKTLEDVGTVYKDASRHNQTRPADDILGDGGMNTVRLRVWADPNKQPPPAAWPTTLGPLASTLRGYVKDTLISFDRAGIDLAIVALGNEIRHVILWPIGYADAARAGVDDALHAGVSRPQIMIHIDLGWNIPLQQRWFGAMVANGIRTTDWDVFGFSFYPFYGTAATFDNLRTTLNTLAWEYKKPIQVVETDYPAICNGEYNPIPKSSEPEIPYSVEGQTIWTRDVISIVKQIPLGLGQGVHYWEPAWLNNTIILGWLDIREAQ
ncbi:putative arabinogalactan endo-beta-1,4-galactanase A [Lachnellula cervina]|uniref:Arabinogalactan endo-beta-1,4-galactanase n=1 Tax=Lachnellula cervina TaxID=1316786 RepID=A0A7D8UWZ0_9HELO|nr:putative arabinogalactan endo-beta-1,4-galactanase A [Lachnellula cervina]